MKLRNLLIPVTIAVQSLSMQAQEAAPDNWFNLDFELNVVPITPLLADHSRKGIHSQ